MEVINNKITLNESKVKFYDDKVEDEKLRHTYWLKNKQLQGVTSTLIKFAFPKKYEGIDAERLNNAAHRGNYIHDEIQAQAYWQGTASTEAEKTYEVISRDYGLKILSTEYLVSDEKELASAVDMVATFDGCEDNEVILIDIKTTSDRYYNDVSLQLSIYAGWFERQNPHLRVKGLYLMWMKPREEKLNANTPDEEVIYHIDDYRFEEVARVDQRVINSLRKAWKTQKQGYVYDASPAWIKQKGKVLAKLMEKQEEIQKQIDAMKAEMLELMNEEHYYSIKSSGLTISKVAATQSPRFNSSKFQAEHGDLYSQYVTMTSKKEFITIKKSKK